MREGLMDDAGVDFDITPPCEKGKECKHLKLVTDSNGTVWAECELVLCRYEEQNK